MKSHNNISAHIDSSTTSNNLLNSSLDLRVNLADQSNRVARTAQMNTQTTSALTNDPHTPTQTNHNNESYLTTPETNKHYLSDTVVPPDKYESMSPSAENDSMDELSEIDLYNNNVYDDNTNNTNMNNTQEKSLTNFQHNIIDKNTGILPVPVYGLLVKKPTIL